MQQMTRWLSDISGKESGSPCASIRLAVGTRNCTGFLTVEGCLVMLSYLRGRVRLGPACEMLSYPLKKRSVPVL